MRDTELAAAGRGGTGGGDPHRTGSGRSRIPVFRRLFAPAVLLALGCAAAASVAADLPAPLRGEPFSDPAGVFPMPPAWVSKPITHAPEVAGADLVIVLDQDIYLTLLPLIEEFGRENRVKVVAREGTCGIAAGKLAEKTIDMGGFCCPPGREDRLPGLRFHTIGIVAKAFLVHPDNLVENLTVEELRKIYQGRIQRWSEVKTREGRPGPIWEIRPLGRLHCQKRPGHWRLLLDRDRDFGPQMTDVGSIPDMLMSVAADRDALGWEVLTMAEKYGHFGKVKPLRVNGFHPTDSGALSRLSYPFYRTYVVSTWEGKALENKNAERLAAHLVRGFERLDPEKYGFVSARRLRQAGWKFKGDELVGEP